MALVAVGARFQGRGLGSELVHAALHWFARQGVSHVSVVTQGRNSAAQALYQRCGFRTAATQWFYHRWFPPT
jgi:ribosomal protein S18 acetylase RimI-like enzyme